MNGSVTGYNKEQIEELRGVINDTAIQSGENICDILHESIIVPISNAWYAPEAVEFFNGFKDAVRQTGVAITEAYDAFRSAIQTAGELWAENTKGDAPVLAPIDEVELDLNVSEIQRDNAGNITIDETEATAVANNLVSVEENIKSNLSSIAAQLDAETAFIGRGQAEAVENCFVVISSAIHKLFAYLTEGEDSLQGQINKAVEKYQTVAEDVTTGFENPNVE